MGQWDGLCCKSGVESSQFLVLQDVDEDPALVGCTLEGTGKEEVCAYSTEIQDFKGVKGIPRNSVVVDTGAVLTVTGDERHLTSVRALQREDPRAIRSILSGTRPITAVGKMRLALGSGDLVSQEGLPLPWPC